MRQDSPGSDSTSYWGWPKSLRWWDVTRKFQNLGTRTVTRNNNDSRAASDFWRKLKFGGPASPSWSTTTSISETILIVTTCYTRG
eukprot:1853672-Rhodomonas_salina.2